MRSFLGIAFIMYASGPSFAHDEYIGLRDNFGYPCCNNTDCEPIDDFTANSDGSVSFTSRRYMATIRVPGVDVVRMSLPGAAAHWCGARHYDFAAHKYDDGYVTFCAFLAPDGN
jgi:hypothetical protein